jgi:prolyl oligopeptidase
VLVEFSSAHVSEDGHYLIVDVSRGCDPTNQLFYYDLAAVANIIETKLNIVPIFDQFDAKYDVLQLI